jgi:NSS family neurotransmitter:Na+ symporter
MAGNSRDSWKTRSGFLLAVIGSAVGLGNIWRFPYLAHKNGGGAFLIPYLIALFTVGIPLMILELGIGHKFRASAPLAFSRIGRKWEGLGWWIVTFVFLGIALYYSVVIAWCINYLKFAFGLEWGSDTSTFFNKEFLGLSSGPYDFGGFNLSIVGSLFLVWFINWWIVFKGIRRGIETASKIMIPFLGIIMLILVVWSLTLPGALGGIKEYLLPDFSRLTDATIWTDAFSQIFFTLSVGFGVIIAYASYLPPKTNFKASAYITSISNCAFSIFAGFAVFATLGFMSHASGKPIGDVVAGGPGLVFITYPVTINMLPFGQKIFGALFFLALIFAGITSSISIFEAAVSSLIDKFGWSRKVVTSVIAVVGFLGGLVFTTGAGLYWLDTVDFFINHFGVLVAGFFEAIVVGWIYKAGKLRDHKNAVGAELYEDVENIKYYKHKFHIGKWWEYVIIIWVPLVLGLLVVLELIKQLQNPYSGYGWLFVIPVGFGWVVMTFAIGWYIKSRAWRKPAPKEMGL